MQKLLRCSIISLVLILAVPSMMGQVVTGTPPFGSFGGGPFDTVNLGNLNVHFAVPILHKAGRGIPFNYDLTYDSSIWMPVTIGGVKQWQPAGNWGWNSDAAALTGYVTATETTTTIPGPPCTMTTYTYSNYVYHDQFGRSHSFVGTTWQRNQPCYHPPILFSAPLVTSASDGSGFSINAQTTTWTITSSSGAVITGPLNTQQNGAGSYTDNNGNKITTNSGGQYYDTLSSTTPVLTVAGSGTPSSPVTFTYSSPSGGSPAYTANYTQYTVGNKLRIHRDWCNPRSTDERALP